MDFLMDSSGERLNGIYMNNTVPSVGEEVVFANYTSLTEVYVYICYSTSSAGII